MSIERGRVAEQGSGGEAAYFDLNAGFHRFITEVYEPHWRKESTNLTTPRKLQILQGMVEGKTHKEIGFQIGVSWGTIRTHVTGKKRRNLIGDLGVKSSEEAVVKGVTTGILDLAGAIERSQLDLNTFYNLTPSEQEVLFTLGRNSSTNRSPSNVQIAEDLSTPDHAFSLHKVINALSSVFVKTGVSSRQQAVLFVNAVTCALVFNPQLEVQENARGVLHSS